jgi:hypothetical protein
MSRNILLVEPNYSNKYPPIGLMKIATYHRILGDNIRFFKGDLEDLVIEQLLEDCLRRLTIIDKSVKWDSRVTTIKQFIKTRKNPLWLIDELDIEGNNNKELILNCLLDFADNFKKKRYSENPKYDRIYVTTLFTFYWKITVETINFCKNLVKDKRQLFVGGVLATLLSDELEKEVGIKPMKGLLDQPGILDPKIKKAKRIIIDNLPLDYSILDEIDYEYPTRSAYFTFMTKGCTRKCAFCSVPILEPDYKPKIETVDKFSEIKERFGDQQNLLLMDNNVLASPKFAEIIEEIKEMGFYKGATYVEPNQLDIAVKNLKDGYNEFGPARRAFRLIHSLIPRLKDSISQDYYNILADNDLLKIDEVSKDKILKVYPLIAEIYEKYRNKTPRNRYVDFNQGTDCRYVTEELMKKMSEIPIRPLRIAFDYIGLKDQYVKAVKLAAKYGIKELSNYILYNFNDKPDDLYRRLEINAELCLELDIAIFSFPMKYIPLFGEDAKHRSFTGPHWNKKFIRAVQSILNVTKGIVAPSSKQEKSSFFREAFGQDINEFHEILYMPEPYIIYRHLFRYELKGTQIWEAEYRGLSDVERRAAHSIIEKNDFSDDCINRESPPKRVKHFLRHYKCITRDDIDRSDDQYVKLKAKYEKLIKQDQFIELTVTYDFESPSSKRKKKKQGVVTV